MSQVELIVLPRQTKFLQMSDADLQEYLVEVESTFGEDWLKQGHEHRLQELWQRPDPNSTIELTSLGYALKTLRERDPEWLQSCLSDIRSDDRNNQHGALFELNLITWMINGGMNVIPAKYSMQGLDATAKFPTGGDVLISMKSHDMSHHERTLQENCNGLRSKAREIFGTRGHSAISIILTASEYFDSKSKWDQLKATFDSWPMLTAQPQLLQAMPGVHLAVVPVPQEAGPFAPGFMSDSFAAIFPFHKNEQPNFISKLNDAALQLKKQCADMPGKKVLFMRVHQTAEIKELGDAATAVVNDSSSGVDLIVLYQPAYTNDPQLEQTTPSLYLAFVPSPTWNVADYQFNLRPLIGRQIINPSRQRIVYPDGSLRELPPNHYFYCTGWHFLQTTKNAKGEAQVNVQRRPNLSVFPVFDGKIIVGLLPPNDEFLVL